MNIAPAGIGRQTFGADRFTTEGKGEGKESNGMKTYSYITCRDKFDGVDVKYNINDGDKLLIINGGKCEIAEFTGFDVKPNNPIMRTIHTRTDSGKK
jgi:hypothetical protein